MAQAVEAANREFTGEFTQECLTVDGDDLDPNGDGICELLTGFRVYTEQDEFIYGMPETGARTWNFLYNAPMWSTQCWKMTAVIDDPDNPGTVFESVYSNTGACQRVVPGNPKPPRQTN
jgi:hypothetical protein